MESALTCRFCGTSNYGYSTDRYGNAIRVKDSTTRAYYKCTRCGYIICADCMRKLKTERKERHVFKSTDVWDACPSCGGKLINIASASGGGGCFITTATLQSLNNNDDNCYELTTFRKFRDSWLKKNHPEDILEYYHVAPLIVSSISSLNNHDEIYQNIWLKYLQPCLIHIENNENENAYNLYKQMVKDLIVLYN